MIYIRIELWPMGDKSNTKLLHEGIIYNTGGTQSKGEYNCIFSGKGGFSVDSHLPSVDVRNVHRSGRVENFPRLAKNAWHLLGRALRAWT